jgi:serine/threonine protein kinase
MNTSKPQLPSCPSCGEAMLPTADQTSWRCRACEPSSPEKGRAGQPIAAGAPPAAAAAPEGGPLSPAASEEEFEPAKLLGRLVGGRYRLEDVLGQGGMGAVYRGVQLALDKPYAIKVLLPSLTSDPLFVARFRQEARIAAAIGHPGIVEVFDYGVEDGIAYYVMELLQGQSLADYIGADRALAPEEAVRIVAAAADAVASAHDRGVIHRDLKPANLFLARGDGGGPVVKVLDFGVSKATMFTGAASEPRTVSGSVCGTPAYMSPEQLGRGKLDARSDLYSLGVVLYRLLTGKVPFGAAEAVLVMYMHLERPAPPLEPGLSEAVPAALQEVLFRSLAKRPEDRFGSMREFAQALRASLDPGAAPMRAAQPPTGEAAKRASSPTVADAPRAPAPERPSGSATPPPREPRRRLAAVSGIGLLAAAAISGVLWRAHRQHRHVDPAPPATTSTVPQADQRAAPEPPQSPPPSSTPPASSTPPPESASPPVGLGPKPSAAPASAEAPAQTSSQEQNRPQRRRNPRPSAPAAASSTSRTADREPPRPPEPRREVEKGELVLTSKVFGKATVAVAGATFELHFNSATLLSVPAGSQRVTFSSEADSASCTVQVELAPKARLALVFGPESNDVALRERSGIQRLSCEGS